MNKSTNFARNCLLIVLGLSCISSSHAMGLWRKIFGGDSQQNRQTTSDSFAQSRKLLTDYTFTRSLPIFSSSEALSEHIEFEAF